jgi:hemoglobin-like flavoprotein
MSDWVDTHHRGGAPTGGRHVAGVVHRPDADTMAVVQRTAAAVSDRPAELAERFYHHLFLLAPALRDMFPADMTAQNERLSRALFDAVRALVDPERNAARMEANLHRLGLDHARRYGVRPEHYPYVGHALVRAVHDVSGDWSASTSSAWLWVYDWISRNMLGDTR